MKYAGMPMGMWALFAPTFRNQLICKKAPEGRKRLRGLLIYAVNSS